MLPFPRRLLPFCCPGMDPDRSGSPGAKRHLSLDHEVGLVDHDWHEMDDHPPF
jgi:hypothetical protein